MSSDKIDGLKLSEYISLETKKHFRRKEFSDFDYLSVELPASSYWLIYIVTLLTNIGIGFFVVKNDIDEDHLRKRRGKR